MPSILFVCKANQFRSPIAAACFSQKLESMHWEGEWNVESAGTWATPGSPALPVTIATARKIDLSLDGHQAQSITPELVFDQDLILTMESGQKEALQNEFSLFSEYIFMLSEVAHNEEEDIKDPVTDEAESFIDSASKINAMIESGFYKICGKALEAIKHKRHKW